MLETKDSLDPLPFMIVERFFAPSVIPDTTPSSCMPCELGTGSVGVKKTVGPDVMILG